MAFQPMLIIGCGGSGGATLQYMMDSLKTELSRQLEKAGAAPLKNLPGAWQFVHVDVPSSAEAGPAERPASVRDQGGTYAGLARPGLTWPMVAESIWTRTKDTRPDLTSGWMRRPGNTDTPLERGAGQERAVGRGVTLNSLVALKNVVDTVAGRLNGGSGMTELRQLAETLGEDVDSGPVVIVVSSMAGGSGASMVLDIPRVVAGYNESLAANTAMFLYTSEVFGSIPPISRRGVEANGLAMMGELLSTSLGSSTSDNELLRLLGFSGQESMQPFKRVFPIGLRHGVQGAIFGDGSLESVYRAVGRALAGLAASPVAMEQFLRYDLIGQSPLSPDTKWLGEGTGKFDYDGLLWGTFGYSRLSLGRDRYGEYVAQRLSRQAVDRLVAGHQSGDEDAGEVDLQRAVDDARRRFLLSMGMTQAANGSALALLVRNPNGEDEAVRGLRVEMREVVGREVFSDGRFAGTLAGQAYVRVLKGVLGQNRHAIDTAIQDWAYGHVFAWHERFVNDVLSQIDSIAALYGLPVARQVILRFKDDLAAWIMSLQTEQGQPNRQAWSPELPPNVVVDVEQNNAIGAGHPMQEKLSKWLSNQVANSAEGAVARQLIGVLEDFGPSFADPLAAALAQQHRSLQEARRRDPELGGQSDLRTASYSDWPQPRQRVPRRFQGAHNEVVLLDVQAFPDQYDAHLGAMTRSRRVPTVQEAENIMLTEILRDRWLEHNDSVSRSQVISMVAAWIPPNLITEPADSTRLRSRSSARFETRLSTGDVIGRAREWVWRQDGEFGSFLSVGLAEYMDPGDAEFEERLRRLTTRFGEAMTQSLPLVSVDPTSFAKVHRSDLAINFKYSGIPFMHSDAVRTALEDEVRRSPGVSQESLRSFSDSLVEGVALDHIDVFATYPPMSPLAFSSLLQPLTNAWRNAVSDGSAKDFWTGRRAHTLPACIPMSPAERQATVAGYVIAKITGRLRGAYQTRPHQPPQPIEVFDQDEDKWLRFPHPMLSPYADKYQMDELPALLESYLLAIAECGHKHDLSPLLPYVSLRHTFATVLQADGGTVADAGNRAFDKSTGDAYLVQWIVDGWRPAAGPAAQWDKDASGSVVDLATGQGRKDAAIGFLTAFRDEYSEHFHPDDPRLYPGFRPFDRRPLMATIAPDFVWAMDEVLAMVEAIELEDVAADVNGPTLVM